MSGWVHHTPVSAPASMTLLARWVTSHAVGTPIDFGPHWSKKKGSLGVSSAWTGKLVTTGVAFEGEIAAAPETNAPAKTRTATMAASRRASALNRGDNRGKPPRFRGLDAHMNRAPS